MTIRLFIRGPNNPELHSQHGPEVLALGDEKIALAQIFARRVVPALR